MIITTSSIAARLAGGMLPFSAGLLVMAIASGATPDTHGSEERANVTPVEGDSTIADLVRIASSKQDAPRYRNEALYELNRLEWPGAMSTLLDIVFKEPEYEGRMALLPVLGSSEHGAAQFAIAHLACTDKLPTIRYAALLFLKPDVVPISILKQSLSDPVPFVRKEAVRAVAKLASQRDAYALLFIALKDERDGNIKELLEHSMKSIQNGHRSEER